MADDVGRQALEAVDAVLADEPDKIGHDFSQATKRLCAWRDELAQRWRETRADNERRSLERLNAALSVVVGGQFPLGSVPWPHIKHVRQDLAELIAGDQPR